MSQETLQETNMTDELHQLPTVGSQVLSALRHYPDRIAFESTSGVLSYSDTLDLIGRMQAVLESAGLRHGDRIGFLMGNTAEAWCAGMAAQLSGIIVTYLHPLGSLDDHLHQISDAGLSALVVDNQKFPSRSAELAVRYLDQASAKKLFTFGPAEFGEDLLSQCTGIPIRMPVDKASPADIALLNYTGGTSGKPKAVVRLQHAQAAMSIAILADFELPPAPRYLAIAPITHVGGTNSV